MKRHRPPLFVLIVLIAGFAGGLFIASSLEWTPVSAGRSKPDSLSQNSSPSAARALADQLSDLFESAADKVSVSVVPIFSEQEVQVASPFGSPEDPFRDFLATISSNTSSARFRTVIRSKRCAGWAQA